MLIALAILPWLPRSLRPHAGPLARPSARPASFLGAARIGLLALALGGVILWSAPAPTEAQTATVLVKNTGQATHSPLAITTTTTRAQGFTTGTAPGGYNLASIGVLFDQIGDVSEAPNAITATINEEVNGTEPGTVFCTLGHPSAYVAHSVNTYDASGCSTLSPNTTYFVVLTRSDASVGGSIWLERTASGNEDGTPATGWSIADIRHYLLTSASSWTTAPETHLIEIKGAAVPDPPKRVTGFDLHSDNSDPRGMWGNEDTFWVANDNSGNGTADKLYAYNRSDGSRDTTNDFDNLNGANNNRPWGICSDGTTMFVGDRDDNELYAYKMSDTTSDTTKDITLDSDNGEPRGMWCDATTVYVANDGDTGANKVFAYKIADGTADSSKDFEQLYVSANTAAQNAETPRGVWSNGTTMFVADSDDDNVFAYKHSDESQDSGKNLALSSANDNPNGMWFDGRILWVVDDSGDIIYPYDLPGAQPDNTPAVGGPAIGSAFTKDVLTATVTSGVIFSPGRAGYAVTGIFAAPVGSISESEFTVEGAAYTVHAVLDGSDNNNSGDLILELDRALPLGFTFTADGVSYSSSDATESEPGTGRYRYQWSANLSWTINSIPVVLNVEIPKDGEEVSADVSGITDSTDGVASAHFQYQWIRVDGMDETDIDGETGSTYTPTDDDVDKHLKVRVVFDDDSGYKEYPLTSPRFGPVVDAVPPTLDRGAATAATTITILFTEPLDPASTPAASAFAVQVGDTANTVVLAEIGGIDIVRVIFPGALILTVSTPMLSRDTITVSYTKPDANPLQDPDRNEVESFSDRPVANTIRETFLSNLGQAAATTTGNLAADDFAQRFLTGSTASFDFTEVEVLFDTAPSGTATVTAIIADGLGSTNIIVATLTNPLDWSTNPRFGIPSGTTLAKSTSYYLVIEGTDGILQSTDSTNNDSGAAVGWDFFSNASVRAMQSDAGLGGTWGTLSSGELFQMAIRGKHHGRPGTPELAVGARDQTLVLDVTVPDHGSSDLTGIEYRYKETTGGTYTGWTSVTEAISNSGGTFEIGGLTNGTEYTAQVQTVNGIGTSGPSNEDSATPDAPPAVTMFAITSDPGADETYAIGDDIEFTLTYDKNLSLGGTDTTKSPGYITYQTEWAEDDPFTDHPSTKACVIGTDTTTLVCTDTVDEGEYDTDGIAVLANALTDLFSLSFFAGPLGQRVTSNNLALAADSNHKVDGVRPELTGARPSADKTKITLTFSEAIGAVDRTKITFDSGGTTLTTTAHSTSDSEVEITLTTALTVSDTNVTVALAADAVADAVGNGNAVLAASPIVDETAPTLSMTSTPSNTEVLLTYNEPLDPDSIPAASAFTANANEIWSATLTVKDTGSDFLDCSNVNIGLPSGDRCSTPSTLTDDAFSYDGTDYEVEVIELKAGTLDIEIDLFLTAAAVGDLTLKVGATSLAFADASHSGLLLRWTSTGLTWSQGETIALSIGGGTARTVSTAALSGTSGIVLTLSPAFRPGDALTVSYTVPETNPIQDIASNDAAALADQAVSNTLAATAPEAVASLTASNTSTFGEADLQWDGGTWANGSAITRHEVRYGAQTPIWSATLTVKDLGFNFLGCDSTLTNLGCEPGELLTDNTFSYDSVDYLIGDAIYLTTGGQLFLATNKVKHHRGGARRPDARRGRALVPVRGRNPLGGRPHLDRHRPQLERGRCGPTGDSHFSSPHGRRSRTAPRVRPTRPATRWRAWIRAKNTRSRSAP